MKWFKHYNLSSEGESHQRLIAEKDFETLYIYWWILEQISKFEDSSCDENRGKITLNLSYFKMKLGLNSQRSTKVLLKIDKTFDLKVSINSDETVSVFSPKWLELQENRGVKKSKNSDEIFEKKAQEERSKKRELDVEMKDLKTTTATTQNMEWFSDFVLKEMQTFDTGLINYANKISRAFVDEKGFRDWFSGVAKTKKFIDAAADEQIRYFKAALSSELKARGVL